MLLLFLLTIKQQHGVVIGAQYKMPDIRNFFGGGGPGGGAVQSPASTKATTTVGDDAVPCTC